MLMSDCLNIPQGLCCRFSVIVLELLTSQSVIENKLLKNNLFQKKIILKIT